MNYYKRHLGDYARKAGHLSMLEHGAYTLILDAYYDREQAPTQAEALRWARARNPEETQVVSTILQEFFFERDGRYYQRRVEDELAAAKAKAEHNRTIGKLGGRPPRERKTHRVSSGLPDGSQTKPQSTNPLIHKSTTKNQEQEPKGSLSAGLCPQTQIIALYHELLPELPPAREWPEANASQLRARWRSSPERQSLDWWRKFFGYVRESDFLMGRKTDFQASLMWLVKAANFAKVVNGNYENRGNA